jgi:hypothetical protein
MPSGAVCPTMRFLDQAIKLSIVRIPENVKEYRS